MLLEVSRFWSMNPLTLLTILCFSLMRVRQQLDAMRAVYDGTFPFESQSRIRPPGKVSDKPNSKPRGEARNQTAPYRRGVWRDEGT